MAVEDCSLYQMLHSDLTGPVGDVLFISSDPIVPVLTCMNYVVYVCVYVSVCVYVYVCMCAQVPRHDGKTDSSL